MKTEKKTKQNKKNTRIVLKERKRKKKKKKGKSNQQKRGRDGAQQVSPFFLLFLFIFICPFSLSLFSAAQLSQKIVDEKCSQTPVLAA